MKSYFSIKYLKHELQPMLLGKYWINDLTAGITVACVAIPLSLAIALASGVSAGSGLISAIIGGIIVALFGGTRLAVTGPAAAMAIIISSAIQQHGLAGLLVIGIICGLLQFCAGLLGLGRFVKLVPLPVIGAFSAGIGLIIVIGQLPKALQLPASQKNTFWAVVQHLFVNLEHSSLLALMLALLTLIILKVLPKFYPKAPTPLIAVLVPSLLVNWLNLDNILLVGSIPHSLPLPQLPNFAQIQDWSELLHSALIVFAVASLETLLSSSAVDKMANQNKHNSNHELIGQGLANFSVALFGGIPVTGVIARSSVNIVAGAKTRRSAIIHSLLILASVYIFPQLIEQIPIAALAGILLSAGLSMLNFKEFVDFWRIDRSEGVIYLITLMMIVLTDLIEGIKAGIILAFLLVAIKILYTKVNNLSLSRHDNSLKINLAGNMVFWSFKRLAKLEQNILSQATNLELIIIDFQQLSGMDLTGANHVIELIEFIQSQKIALILSNLSLSQRRLLLALQPKLVSIMAEDDLYVQKVLDIKL